VVHHAPAASGDLFADSILSGKEIMRTILMSILLCLVFARQALPQEQQSLPQLNLMPMPRSVQRGTGRLIVASSFSIAIDGYKNELLERAAQRLFLELSRQTGISMRGQLVDHDKATLVIHADHASKSIQELGEGESYTLDVTTSGAKLAAPNPLGILRGLETFRQLVEITPDGFSAPVVHIEDQPRFPWRGLTIDVSRHFIPFEVLQRNVDAMAAVKLNVLHLHLSDDQGFRVESKKFPKLQEMGSDGLYYTQNEIRELVAYARDRGIRIVPEFDIPGHSTSWFVGYPELASAPGPYQIERKWGIFDPAMDPTREETYVFLDKLIGEMVSLFPDRYFHIGGDEVNGKQWSANSRVQNYMRAHNMKTTQELQQYFTSRVQKIVSKHQKFMDGWDEILSPMMPKDIVIQSWHGQDFLMQAARQGYRGLLSHGYYLDAMAAASDHYQVDPLPNADATLSSEERARILGGEACMWGEFVDGENIDSRIWPRTAAIAERFWSPEETRDVESMYRRLDVVSWRLQLQGLMHRSATDTMLVRMAASGDITVLRILASAVVPSGLFVRQQAAIKAGGIQTSDLPLNRFVDAVAPESDVSRLFTTRIAVFVNSKFSDAVAEAQIRAQLTAWRDNAERLQPLLDGSFLLKELTPVSQNLAALGTAGLQALNYIDKGERAPESWKSDQVAMIAQMKTPKADVLLAVAPAVQTLIEASAAAR
jgi:hexosaminidase